MTRRPAMFIALLAACSGKGGGAGDDSADESAGSIGPTDLATAADYPALRLDVDYVAGKGPDEDSLAAVEDELSELVDSGHIGKPDGIAFALDDEIEGANGATVRTFEELDVMLEENAGPDTDGETVVVHVLYADGSFEDDTDTAYVLGFAYGDNKLVMLRDNIDRSCDAGIPAIEERLCRLVESQVLLHEMGHLFGLVNNGLSMVEDHQDAEHGAHDSNDECLMYWLNNQNGMVESLVEQVTQGDDATTPFDNNCLADLASAQAQ